jgi:two-component system, NtrC family, response regulator PilR
MRILVVDDELSMREYLEVLLARAGYEVVAAANVAQAAERLREDVDLVISDMKLGAESGLSVLKAARAIVSPPEVILITAYGTPESAVEAMRAGAYDYICKPFDNEELKLLVQKALEKRELRREVTELRSTLSAGAGRVLLGRSAGMQAVWGLIDKVATGRSTVLITGESGTGKELVARAIHARGARAGQPFLPLNCAAMPEGLLESELFGHVKGAFTGAAQDRPGLLVSAGEGTVFLDEIGEVSPAMQVKLLRVLQERQVKPVGSASEVPFKARVLAATNKRLEDEVKVGRFREDLLYRLNVITLELPPLRDRGEDIPVLAEHFLARMRDELGRPNLRFTPEALGLLQRFGFPGNVRQLQNIVERAATLADGEELGPDSLPTALRGDIEPVPAQEDLSIEVGFSLERHLDSLERRYLLSALEQAGGVKTRAADLLGLTFRSFRYRLAKHGFSVGDDEPQRPR